MSGVKSGEYGYKESNLVRDIKLEAITLSLLPSDLYRGK